MNYTKDCKIKGYQKKVSVFRISRKSIVSSNFLWYAIRFIFVIIMSLVIMNVISFFLITTIDIEHAQSKIIFYRLIYSQSGISYYDPDINKVYPGIIDPARIEDNKIDKGMLMTPNYVAAAKITLKDSTGASVKEGYMNKEWYEKWKPVAQMELPGSGGAETFIYETYVLIKDKKDSSSEQYKQGSLTIDIVLPR